MALCYVQFCPFYIKKKKNKQTKTIENHTNKQTNKMSQKQEA